MTPSKPLPARPSLASLRKQAKKLARDIAAGDAEAIARARVHLPGAAPPLALRDAQLVLAREYGFAGWQALREDVLKRGGAGLDQALAEAGRAIHGNDLDRLRLLLAEHPALLTWRDAHGATLLSAATTAFADSGDAAREQNYLRPACVELLIDAGAASDPSVWENVIGARAKGMLELLWRKGVLPRTPTILAALGDLDGVRACLDDAGRPDAATAAFMAACRFRHAAIAAFLLEHCIARDPELGRRIDAWQGRAAFIAYLGEHPQVFGGPWQSLVMNEVLHAIEADDGAGFTRWLRREPALLGDACLGLQVELIERAALTNRGAFITRLLDLDPALLRRQEPPRSSAIVFAIEYGHAHLLPLLTPIWPLPDDLPHAAGAGDFARVRRWFDAAGRPALGRLEDHYPISHPPKREHLGWGAGTAQQVLDVALAWACMNRHFGIADFLLAHGADINTRWSTHEPASLLHECALRHDLEMARFLVGRGIDLTIRDHRWNATAEGWAWNAAKDEAMTAFLAAERERRERS